MLATLLVGSIGCSDRLEPDTQRIDEVLEKIESIVVEVSSLVMDESGAVYGHTEMRSWDPGADEEEIRQLARREGLTAAETDILLKRMAAGNPEPARPEETLLSEPNAERAAKLTNRTAR